MQLADNELARRSNGLARFREAPFRLRWLFDSLPTADAQILRVAFSCSVRLLAQPVERQAFEELFLSTASSINIADILVHFQPSLERAAMQVTTALSAEHVNDNLLRDAIVGAGNSLAFICGMELMPPYQIDIDRPSIRHQLIPPLEPIAKPEFVPCRIWTVSGFSIIRIDSAVPDAPPQRIDLPNTLGPLRSIQLAEVEQRPMLLVGARSGFFVMTTDGDEIKTYHAEQLASEHGFSKVLYSPLLQSFFACHSEGGIIHWTLNHTAQPAHILPAPPAPRLLHRLDQATFVFVSGRSLFSSDPDHIARIDTPPLDNLVAILDTPTSLLLVERDGDVYELDKFTRQIRDVQTHPSAICAAAIAGDHLLLALENAPLRRIDLRYKTMMEYHSPHMGLRALAADDSNIAAISPDRQRLILWRVDSSSRPAAELHLGAQTHHRLAGVIVTSNE